MSRTFFRWVLCALCLLALACAGTDFIADPPVTMEPVLQPTLVVTPDMAAVEVGASRSLDAVYRDEMGTTLTGVAIIWSVSDATVAEVDDTGRVSGLSEGQVTITARVGDTVSDPVVIGVVGDPEAVALVRIGSSPLDLTVGDLRSLSAESTNSRSEILDRDFSWQSSDEAVVTVDDQGQITALSPGQATVSAETDGVTSNLVRVTVFGPGRTGMFEPNPNSGYTCEGSVVLQESDSGGLELSFEDDFVVSSGPRLEVFLSTTNMVGPGSLQLQPVKSFSGQQTYPIDEAIGIQEFDWVIIHCVPFNVTFGYAQLR